MMKPHEKNNLPKKPEKQTNKSKKNLIYFLLFCSERFRERKDARQIKYI